MISTQTLPRPRDEGFIEWMQGKKVKYDTVLLFDSYWTIEKGEVSNFRVLRITENQAEKIYSATISFKATAKGTGIDVSEAIIRYKDSLQDNKLTFMDFIPVKFSKIGN